MYGMSVAHTLHLQGSWNLRNATFAEPGQLGSWAVASLVRKQEAEGANSLQVWGVGQLRGAIWVAELQLGQRTPTRHLKSLNVDSLR